MVWTMMGCRYGGLSGLLFLLLLAFLYNHGLETQLHLQDACPECTKPLVSPEHRINEAQWRLPIITALGKWKQSGSHWGRTALIGLNGSVRSKRACSWEGDVGGLKGDWNGRGLGGYDPHTYMKLKVIFCSIASSRPAWDAKENVFHKTKSKTTTEHPKPKNMFLYSVMSIQWFYN